MAREEAVEEHILEEMPACLRELFEQTNQDESTWFPQNDYHSAKSCKSAVTFYGKYLSPPMLTEDERAEMRQHRRDAVKCEAVMFERRRNRYSSLILQVIAVMDKIQVQAKNTGQAEDYAVDVTDRTLTEEMSSFRNDKHSIVRDVNQMLSSKNSQFDVHDLSSDKKLTRYVSYNGNSRSQEHFTRPLVDWAALYKDDLSNRSSSQTGYGPCAEPYSAFYQREEFVKDPAELASRNKVLREMSQRSQSRFREMESTDFLLDSTLIKDTFDHDRIPSQAPSKSLQQLYVLPSHKLLPSLHDHDGENFPSDSLASTSLSMAFTDSSYSTVQSVGEMESRSAAQRQLYMDSATKEYNVYQKHYSSRTTKHLREECEKNTRSESQELNTNGSSKPMNSGPKSLSQGKDKTLEHLDKLKQKLLEEKEKQLQALKQQELARLRSLKKGQKVDLEPARNEPQSSRSSKCMDQRSDSESLPEPLDAKQLPDHDSRLTSLDRFPMDHENSRTFSQYRPLSVLSVPPSDMYMSSILENSSENFDTSAVEDNLEPESLSDKENFVVNSGAWVNTPGSQTNQQDVSRNVLERRKDGQGINPVNQRMGKKMPPLGSGNQLLEGKKFAKVSALAKGFLTRLLLKTEKVHSLIQTIKDTRDFLADISKEDSPSFNEKMLKENVENHLKAARYGLYDVFCTIPMKERMSYIAQSRNSAMEKKARKTVRQQSTGSQAKLSAVTLRAIQRRQEGLEQKATRKSDTSAKKPKLDSCEEKKRSKNWNIRVLKPQQGHTSPPLPDKTRSKKPNTRPTTAPERPMSSRLHKADANSRPKTTGNAQFNNEKSSRLSLGGGSQPARKSGRLSLGGSNRGQKATGPIGNGNSGVQPRGQKKFSLPESAQPRLKGHAASGNNEVVQRPRTASDVRRGARSLAANFAK